MQFGVTVKIRNAGVEDAEAICALAKELERIMISLGTPAELKFSAYTYRRDAFGKEPHFQGLVAESGGDITGYLLYHFGYDFDRAKPVMQIIHLYLRPEYRRQGIRRALMEKAGEVCRNSGGIGLKWEVLLTNEEAIGFYKSLGSLDVSKISRLMYLPLD